MQKKIHFFIRENVQNRKTGLKQATKMHFRLKNRTKIHFCKIQKLYIREERLVKGSFSAAPKSNHGLTADSRPLTANKKHRLENTMNISIICIGKLKEKYWTEAVAEYSKRLSKFCTLQILELKEARLPDNASPAEEEAVKVSEGQEILKHIKKDTFVITLEIKGKALSSEGLAEKMEELALLGKSNVAFVIGGSLGLSKDVSARADFKLSFSAMTFPHQMMRVILLEQVYRAYKINKGEKYHK